MSLSSSSTCLLTVYCVLSTTVGVSATYLPWTGSRDIDEKSNAVRHQPMPDDTNSRHHQHHLHHHHHHHHHQRQLQQPADSDRRRRKAFFGDDAEIHRYLKGQGRQLMLWRCRNAIQQLYSRHKPLAFVELFCDVIGTIEAVTWSHGGLQVAGTDVNVPPTALSDAERYRLTVATHSDDDDGRHYAAWLDFRLRIYNATRRDSGVYWFRATSPGGDVERHAVFVDIAFEQPPAISTLTSSARSKEAVGEEVDHRQQQQQPSSQISPAYVGGGVRKQRKKSEKRTRRASKSTANNEEEDEGEGGGGGGKS